MLWSIRNLMKPALPVVEMIPNVHRTQALAALRKAAIDGRTSKLHLFAEEKDLAFYDGPVALISPIGARLLRALYDEGRIKLKKPGAVNLQKLDAYIATEPAFRAEVARIEAEDDAKRQRLAEIIADPSVARPDELSPYLIDKVYTAAHGHNHYGTIVIGGVTCHKSLSIPPAAAGHHTEGVISCWWLDAEGNRQGDPAQA